MSFDEYGVVVCPKCKRSWGVKLSQKTTKCPQCGKSYKISMLKIFYKTFDLRKLQIAVAKTQKKLLQ